MNLPIFNIVFVTGKFCNYFVTWVVTVGYKNKSSNLVTKTKGRAGGLTWAATAYICFALCNLYRKHL